MVTRHEHAARMRPCMRLDCRLQFAFGFGSSDMSSDARTLVNDATLLA